MDPSSSSSTDSPTTLLTKSLLYLLQLAAFHSWLSSLLSIYQLLDASNPDSVSHLIHDATLLNDQFTTARKLYPLNPMISQVCQQMHTSLAGLDRQVKMYSQARVVAKVVYAVGFNRGLVRAAEAVREACERARFALVSDRDLLLMTAPPPAPAPGRRDAKCVQQEEQLREVICIMHDAVATSKVHERSERLENMSLGLEPAAMQFKQAASVVRRRNRWWCCLSCCALVGNCFAWVGGVVRRLVPSPKMMVLLVWAVVSAGLVYGWPVVVGRWGMVVRTSA